MAVHKRQDRRPPPSVTRTAPTRGPPPLSSRQCAFNSSACRPPPPGQREPGGYTAAQNTRVGFFILLWALCFIQALVIPIAVERAPEASRSPISAKLNTDVAAASPLTAGSGPLPAGNVWAWRDRPIGRYAGPIDPPNEILLLTGLFRIPDGDSWNITLSQLGRGPKVIPY
ncbi:hypothetical protein C8R45DRAFT_929437 [Mycena sanguinolenta]|nr:hypothetical protein C8R45DRAFT_929437 [Mycena sanguinolenta]